MKKILAIALVLSLTGLIGCGSSSTTAPQPPGSDTTNTNKGRDTIKTPDGSKIVLPDPKIAAAETAVKVAENAATTAKKAHETADSAAAADKTAFEAADKAAKASKKKEDEDAAAAAKKKADDSAAAAAKAKTAHDDAEKALNKAKDELAALKKM